MRAFEVYGPLNWKLQEVSQSCNMLQLGVEQCGSVSAVCRHALTVISIKILHVSESLLTWHM